MGEVMSARKCLPGWTRDLAARHDAERFTADMAELHELAEKVCNALKVTTRRPEIPEPGQVHRDAYLAANNADMHFGRAADIGIGLNPWPWDWAKARIVKWGKETEERRAAA